MTSSGRAGRRRELAVTVLACAAGAGLALFAGSRTWLVETSTRPGPLGPVSTPRTGAALVPALTAVTLVMLAGAGALLAARGWGRRFVGMLIVVAGLIAAGLAVAALRRDGVAVGWILATMIGGLVAAGAGALAVVRGAAWPALGARYQRPSQSHGRFGAGDRTGGSDQAGSGAGGSGAEFNQALWDAVDRGEDPTKS